MTNLEFENNKLTKTLDTRKNEFNNQLASFLTKNEILENNLLENKNSINNLNENLYNNTHSSLNEFNSVIRRNDKRLKEQDININNINQEIQNIKNEGQENEEADNGIQYSNNNNYRPSPPAPGAGAIVIIEDNKNEQISADTFIKDIESRINEHTANQQNIVNQYDNNVDNAANFILDNSDTIDPNNPPSDTTSEIVRNCNEISDTNWRISYSRCLTNAVFLHVLREQNIYLTQHGYIIYDGVLHNDISLLQFINSMSNTNCRIIPTVTKYNGNLIAFLHYITTSFDTADNCAHGIYFKYIVSLYNLLC